jgi:hypothetical protein
MTIKRTAFVSFFSVYPPKFGSAVVSKSFFESWPDNNKKLFQISHIFKLKKKKIFTIKIIKENIFLKLISVFIIFFYIYHYLKNARVKILIIEGASWVGYSFIIIILSKIFFNKIFIIYKGHSIEYEIRKKNYFIGTLSFLFEKFVYKISDIKTSVSTIEAEKIFKFYGIRPVVFPNVIKINNSLKEGSLKFNNLPKRYLFYSGSYDYYPNKLAIDYLVKNIFPKILIKDKSIKLVLTGGGNIKYNHNWLINLGVVSQSRYLSILKRSICLIIPSRIGFGTRVKIIEALCYGAVIISSKIGIEGIELSKHSAKSFFICDKTSNFVDTARKVILDSNYKKIAKKNSFFYRQTYSSDARIKDIYKLSKKFTYD